LYNPDDLLSAMAFGEMAFGEMAFGEMIFSEMICVARIRNGQPDRF